MEKLTLKKLVKLSKKKPILFVAGSLVTALSNAYALTPNTTALLERIESRSPTIETAEAIVKTETLLFLNETAEQASPALQIYLPHIGNTGNTIEAWGKLTENHNASYNEGIEPPSD